MRQTSPIKCSTSLISQQVSFFLAERYLEYFSLIVTRLSVLSSRLPLYMMLCSRCAQHVRITVTRVDLQPLDIQGDVRRIDCIDGGHFINVTLNDEAIDVNDTYDDQAENGWREVKTDRDKVLYYVLSQIVYPNVDAPQPDRFESLYALADKLDVVSLRWQGGRAVGFYTVKFAGMEVPSMRERYGIPVVDTVYVRSEYRNRGFGTEILHDVIARFPNEDIGFSKPISNSMLRSSNEYNLGIA
ncbi:soluble lamin-associated protein of 75 kDa-like isoform X2 [Odontomachus brunneus]|uniref:soluble lamin-associated protein of 75 kDa-like isoform X2 n=1 Tax=Odontomachus brunneus TaxID=486640 RepID=UPI0013F22E1D|nr:soluble lamin-associated protein of 75 kDa-like isoform X2 [Odontomachus brunneus]